MNNQIPFFNPYMSNGNPLINQNTLDRIEEKIERLEKKIRILENRINNLEKNNNLKNNNYLNGEPTDMYMI